MTKLRILATAVIGAALAASTSTQAQQAQLKVLTAGAFRQVVVAMVPAFEKQTGQPVTIDNDTVGALAKRIAGGERFDVAIVSPEVVDDLVKKGIIAEGTKALLARVGVGVMVREGAPVPDVSTVDKFKQAVLAAKTVAYSDPATGGSSGIYMAKLLDRMGIADQVRPKAKLKQGGAVADLLVSGEAELGIHQISEIILVKGVKLIAPLPKEIQNYTVYAAGVSTHAANPERARALVKWLGGPNAADVYKAKGMESAGS
jgi:molybdate transport system substrate-binding protein